MKKMMMILAILFVLFGSSFAGGAGVVYNVKISQINTESQHVRVWFTGDQFTNHGTIQQGCFLFVDNTVEGQRKMAVLLSALQNQNPVDLYASGTVWGWSKEFYRLNAIYIKAK